MPLAIGMRSATNITFSSAEKADSQELAFFNELNNGYEYQCTRLKYPFDPQRGGASLGYGLHAH